MSKSSEGIDARQRTTQHEKRERDEKFLLDYYQLNVWRTFDDPAQRSQWMDYYRQQVHACSNGELEMAMRNLPTSFR